jgi:hypothetical protein
MKKPRTLQFAAAGASISLMLVAVGYRIDAAVPAITLDQQVLYNWLTLLLSPASFLVRLTNPDAPIVPSAAFAAGVIAINALWYAAARHIYLVIAQPTSSNASVSSAALVGAHSSSSHFSSRRGSPSERLADRYEHRLSAEQADSAKIDDPESAVLSGPSRR